MLALFLGLIVSAGLYFAYLWPSVEPSDAEPATVAADSPTKSSEEPANADDPPAASEAPPADTEAEADPAGPAT